MASINRKSWKGTREKRETTTDYRTATITIIIKILTRAATVVRRVCTTVSVPYRRAVALKIIVIRFIRVIYKIISTKTTDRYISTSLNRTRYPIRSPGDRKKRLPCRNPENWEAIIVLNSPRNWAPLNFRRKSNRENFRRVWARSASTKLRDKVMRKSQS